MAGYRNRFSRCAALFGDDVEVVAEGRPGVQPTAGLGVTFERTRRRVGLR